MENKSYIVIVTDGRAYEWTEYNKFVTQDKRYAEKWVEQFNRVMKNHKDRISKFVQSDAFMNSEKEFSLHEYVHYNDPSASYREIELR